ncbi:hypothetical protein BC835DRAFT_1412551 [Cytidiella melzeri]|nr:hypothetical protein BC835DRAFT_1412551 [Cytidiella melzeri]
MSKIPRNAEKNNRRLTDFFTRRSSMMSSPLPQPPSSQPSSSQPRPSQQTAGSSTSHSRKKKIVPSGPSNEVISLSSDSGPIVISSDTSRSHISISSNSTSHRVSSDPSPQNKPKPAATASSSAKSTNRTKPNPRDVITNASIAKTTMKKRSPSSAAPVAPPLLKLPKVMRAPKRKCHWESSSSSEESDDGRIYVPKPSEMKASLTHAPIPRVLSKSALPSPSLKISLPSSPLTSLRSVRSKSSRSSKRARLDVTEPSTAISGNDADEEELVPSSQSDEQELTIPKNVSKDPGVVKATVNKWRRESSAAVSPVHTSSSFPLDEPPATPPATSPAELIWPSDAPSSPLSAMQTDYDGDVHMDDSTSTRERPDAIHGARSFGTHSQAVSEDEVSHQLHLLNSASSTTLSSHNVVLVTPPRKPKMSSSVFDQVSVPMFRPLTPLPSDEPPKARATPVALNPEQKTAILIARLRAEAAERAAEARGSSEEEQPSLDDLLSDSSDEELLYNNKDQGKGSLLPAKAESPSTHFLRAYSQDEKPIDATRYSMRRRPSPILAFNRADYLEYSKPKPSPRKSANPLDKLLREKKAAEKKGNGINSLLAAEAVLANSAEAKGKMKAEMDTEEYDDGINWGDEVAAMRVVIQTSKNIDLNATCPGSDADDSDNDAEEFVVDDATKLLGGDEGKTKAVNSILTKDRKSWLGKKRAKKVVQGVPLWDDDVVPQDDVKSSIPDLPFDESLRIKNTTLQFLHSVVAANGASVSNLYSAEPTFIIDASRLSRCLIPQLFSNVERTDLLTLIPWLTSMALSSSTEILAQRAISVVAYIARRCARTPLQVCPLVVSCLRGLGAKEERLAHISTHAADAQVRSSPLLRGYNISRLVQIVKLFVENDTIAPEDIPELVTTLLLVGLDPSISSSLRTEITVLIDEVGVRIPSKSDGLLELEPMLCARLLKHTSSWSIMNKSYLLTLLRGGSPQIARISRWLGYAMLLNVDIPTKGQYFTLPALEPVINLLSRKGGAHAVFDVMGNADKDDFCEQLSHNIDILETVLYDIDTFVQEEKQNPPIMKLGDDSSRPGSPEKPEPELEQIVELLEKVHGKINDSRAGDLGRSRVKASLQHCWSRVRYQRLAALRAGSAGRPRNLKGYFPRPVQSSNTSS